MVKKVFKKKKKSSEVKVEEEKVSSEPKEEISEATKSIQSEEFVWEEYAGSSEVYYEKVLTRTDLLLLDYKQFKAARTIQTAARAWYARRIYLRKRQAAIIIQRYWRGFYYKRFFYKYLEDELQRRIVKNFNDSAIRIQAYWRGWWVRNHIHDHYRLLRAQVRAAEELLHCVAFKLHYLLRTHQIPGIYSLRHSNALSKVEKLLKMLRYKHPNRQMLVVPSNPDEAPKRLEESRFEDLDPECDPKCKELYKQKDADVRMHRILSMYRDAVIDPKLLRMRKCMEKRKRTQPCKNEKPTATFCDDVVKSLHRWRILNPRTTKIDPEIFKTPENVDAFLSEIQSIYDRMINDPCVCLATRGSLSSIK